MGCFDFSPYAFPPGESRCYSGLGPFGSPADNAAYERARQQAAAPVEAQSPIPEAPRKSGG